ncbi:hypothetical protein ACFVTE_11475 [Arthrobacter sp. NPDC058097]|uniref:hypothetical protein n=1 Tax=Arthrobacter sp. NPDC058097 TaxID=3346340 RepID=UPI0036DBC6B5
MMHGPLTHGRRTGGPLTRKQRLRQLANVLNASTPLGLVLAGLAGTRTFRGPRGLIVATGYHWRLPVAGAFTVGNVVIFRADADTASTGHALMDHEERHSTQYACLGPLFLLFYFAAAAWSAVRYGDPASGNPFERHAGLEAGGYVDRKLQDRRRWHDRSRGPDRGHRHE